MTTIIEAANELSDALDPAHQAIRDYSHTEQEAREQIQMLIPLAEAEIASMYGTTRLIRVIRALLQARRALEEVR